MTTRRRFLQTTLLGVAAGTIPEVARGGALESVQAAATPRATLAIIDWHAHWVGPRVTWKALIFSGNARRLLAAKGVGRG